MEIILIRHGKSTSENNPIVNACGYTKWIRRYSFSDVAKNSRPESVNEPCKLFYTISSDLKRVIRSVNIHGATQSTALLNKKDIVRTC